MRMKGAGFIRRWEERKSRYGECSDDRRRGVFPEVHRILAKLAKIPATLPPPSNWIRFSRPPSSILASASPNLPSSLKSSFFSHLHSIIHSPHLLLLSTTLTTFSTSHLSLSLYAIYRGFSSSCFRDHVWEDLHSSAQ